ncbi:lysosomal membrane ascorbate-dependent ferrireductase CYB561A3 [Rhynchocyon petersi]
MAVRWFYVSCLALVSLGSLCILLTVYWMQYWRGGFAWDGSIHMFNWHPVLMVAGMVVVYGAASLVYRLPQSWVGPKLPWKVLHAALHLLAFILAVLGLVAVFAFHKHNRISNLYSLHSWMGIITVFFFACQWFLGFTVFLLPWASLWLRSLLKPIHIFCGTSIFSLAIVSVISGINEKLFFSLKNSTKPYSSLPNEAVLANSTGVVVVAFGLLVLYILASSWKRPEPGILTDTQVRLHDPYSHPCCVVGSEAGEALEQLGLQSAHPSEALSTWGSWLVSATDFSVDAEPTLLADSMLGSFSPATGSLSALLGGLASAPFLTSVPQDPVSMGLHLAMSCSSSSPSLEEAGSPKNPGNLLFQEQPVLRCPCRDE